MTTIMPKNEVEFYDAFWTTDESAKKPANMERVGLVVDHVLSALESCANPSVIDVGCGNGWILQHLKQQLAKPARLFGIEPSGVGVQNTRRKLPEATVWQGVSSDIPAGHQFNVVISSEVIEHAQDQNRFLQDLAGVLVDGGVAVLTTDNGQMHDAIMEQDNEGQPREDHLTPVQLQALCGKYLRIEKYTTFNIALYYNLHPRFKRWRQRLFRVPLLWRVTSIIDNYLMRRRWRGCYQLIVLRKRKENGTSLLRRKP